jgi:signal transduction histidine kinase
MELLQVDDLRSLAAALGGHIAAGSHFRLGRPADLGRAQLGRSADARLDAVGYVRHVETLRRRPLLVDAAIAAAFVVVAELEVLLGVTTRDPVLHAVLAPLFLAPLAVRRRFPLPVLALAVASLLVLDPQAQLSFFGAQIIASYTVGSVLAPPRAYLGPLLSFVPFFVLIVFRGGVPSDLVAYAMFYVGPWFVGRLVRQRVEQANELVRLAQRERERETASAVVEERARIARELHDIVAHAISVVTVQTQAVRRRLGPEHEREADDLRAVEATAREAMQEMRRLFGVLRANADAPAALAPQPGLDQLERLVEQTRSAGLRVELRTEGTPVPLPPGVDLAAYRVVQEALTNALRHSGGSAAHVDLRYGDTTLELVVDDDGAGGTPNGRGHGLVGMRERVTLYGGELEVGPCEGGGFRVRARLPFRGAA